MAEARLREVWAGLMPSFPEPATLLDISDPDERAVTILLKTLYVLFKGINEERHQLLCGAGNSSVGRRTSAPGQQTTATEQTSTAQPTGVTTTEARPTTTEDGLNPSSPGDLVPPSPSDMTYFSQPKRAVSTTAGLSGRQTVLAPETSYDTGVPRSGLLPRPVPETAPLAPLPPVVWVPETLEPLLPVRDGHRPCPVAETLQPMSMLPQTPPRPLRQLEAVSPVLSGRSPSSRRARRAANRAGAAASPVPPRASTPKQTSVAAEVTKTPVATTERREEVVSPTPSLSSPLLLPQLVPDRSRRPVTTETTVTKSPKGKTVASETRGASRLSRKKPSQEKPDQQSASARRTLQSSPCQASPAKKKKYLFIGPDDPIPPRKPRENPSPEKNAHHESSRDPTSVLTSHQRPQEQQVLRSDAVTPTKTSARGRATPTKRTSHSIFELGSADSNRAHQASTSGKVQNATNETSPGKRTSPRRKTTPKKPDERNRHAAAGFGHSSQESVVEIDVLLGEIDREGAQTQTGVGGLAQGQSPSRGHTKRGDSRKALAELQRDANRDVLEDDGLEEDETTAPPDYPPEHDSQETQMDSLLLDDQEEPVAGPAYKYDAGPVRRRADRQKLPGWACAVCKEWYSDRNMTEEELRKHMNRCSRHRQKSPPPPDTPPGFWDPVAFPSMNITQYGSDGPRTRARRKL